VTVDESVAAARALIGASRRIVAFTGAGVSTPSGIPDFRSPGGVWSRFQPVTIQEFVSSEDGRQRYWEMRRQMWPDFARARPNVVHESLARLEADGRLLAVVTQNIDGLHQLGGCRKVVELHGTNRRAACLDCGREEDMAAVQAALRPGGGGGGGAAPRAPTRCGSCNGFLKAATISFGQALRPEVLREAFALAASCDLLLALGSSLVVYPAAALPEAARSAGARMILVNRDETPLDHLAQVRIHAPLEDVVPRMASA
jgi:NAD-dependent deacetylase